MNRRSFFKKASTVTALACVAPVVVARPIKPMFDVASPEGSRWLIRTMARLFKEEEARLDEFWNGDAKMYCRPVNVIAMDSGFFCHFQWTNEGRLRVVEFKEG